MVPPGRVTSRDLRLICLESERTFVAASSLNVTPSDGRGHCLDTNFLELQLLRVNYRDVFSQLERVLPS